MDEVVVSAPNYLTFEEWLDTYSPEDLIPGVNEQQLFKQYQMHRYKYGASDYTALPQFQEPGAPVVDATMADRAKKKFNLNKTLDTLTPYLNEALPYLRETNTRPLPLSQITPELSVMGDREEPVYAQTLQPNLAVAFDIVNPQADLNDVDAQVNAAIKAAGSDAAAQAAIKKNFDLGKFKKNKGLASASVKFKEQRWIPLSKAFQDITSIPGIPEGHITLLRGHSDTGKTTALLEAAVAAQKMGVLPVFIITEMK